MAVPEEEHASDQGLDEARWRTGAKMVAEYNSCCCHTAYKFSARGSAGAVRRYANIS